MRKRMKWFVLAMLICFTLLLSACVNGSNQRVVIYTAAEEERIAFLQQKLNQKFPDIEIVIQSLGTGQLLSKLQAEGDSTGCDIFYDLDSVNAEIILSKNPDMFADLSAYDLSIYDESVLEYTSRHKQFAVNGKTYGAFLVNKKMLQEKGLVVPTTYQDILSSDYVGLVAMPSPMSSGTGYSLYNGVLSVLGDEDGMKYFEKLNSNIKEYTTSGSAPIKSVVRGDVAIGFGLLWQCVEYANTNTDLAVVIPDSQLPYGLFVMGMISGHETNVHVKAVFDYLYNDLNERQCAKYNPDKIYTDMPAAEIANYPVGFTEIQMENMYDYQHKQSLLDKWVY